MKSKWKLLSIIGAIVLCVVVIAFDSRNSRGYIPMIAVSGTLNFGPTLPATSSDLTMTVTGSAVGDVVMLGIPNASMPANGGFVAWISATNTATVRYFNMDALSTLDPASGTFKLTVIKN